MYVWNLYRICLVEMYVLLAGIYFMKGIHTSYWILCLNANMAYIQCFQDVRLITTNRPGWLELLDQGLRLGQTVQEIGRPISRHPVAINRSSRLCGRPAREWAASQSWA
jgi:hypothetical protein